MNADEGAPPGPPPPPLPFGTGVPTGYQPPQATNTNAIVAICCAAGAWLVCPVIPAIVAIVFARKAEEEIAAGGGVERGQDLARIARILAWVHLAFIAVGVAVVALLIGLSLAAGSN